MGYLFAVVNLHDGYFMLNTGIVFINLYTVSCRRVLSLWNSSLKPTIDENPLTFIRSHSFIIGEKGRGVGGGGACACACECLLRCRLDLR